MADIPSGKIRKYRKPINLNIGMIIFGLLAFYILVCIYMYTHSKHIIGYQVKTGALSSNNVYTAIAIRNEEVVPAEHSGYINFYAGESTKVGVGNLIYTIDESGKLSEYLNTGDYGDNSLTDDDLSSVRSDIINYSANYDREYFDSVYDFKMSMESMVLKLANDSIMQGIRNLNTGSAGELVDFCYAKNPGIVVYSIDGYENLTPAQVTEKCFDREEYEKKQILNNDLVESGEPIFKQITSEDWSIVIPVDEEKAKYLEEAEYVTVRFLKNQETLTGKVIIFRQDSDHIFCQLSFSTAMISYCTDRYLDVELILTDETGLKIPNSSIVNKDFFLIPESFVTTNDDSVQGTYVLRQTYREDGSTGAETVMVEIYNKEKETGEYYLDDSSLRIGDTLVKNDTQERFTVSKQGSLIGVYNINKGYADFKQVRVLYQNDEYSIVESNTAYGLNVYDFIVLDSSTVNADDFIYD